MAALILPSRRVVQPQGPVGAADTDLGRSLVHALVPTFGGFDPISGRPVTLGGVALAGRDGLTRVQTGTQKAFTIADSPEQRAAEITLWVRARRTADAASFHSLFGKNWQSNAASTYVSYGITCNPSGLGQNVFTADHGYSGGILQINSSVTDSTQWNDICIRIDPRGLYLFFNGRQVNFSTAQASSPIAYGASGDNSFGTNFTGSSAGFDFAAGYLFKRGLEDAEISALTQNPWQPLRPIQRRIWVPVAGGVVSHATSGALANAGGATAGAADSATARASSGVLANPGGTAAGTAARTRQHPATGVLANPGGTTTGTATRIRAFASSGTLANPGATTSGSADSATARSSSGVLSGAGGQVAGSADHIVAGGTHVSTGALANPGGTTSGAAARTRALAASGVLSNSGGQVAGVASRQAAAVSHATTGVLANSGAAISGTAQNGVSVIGKGFEFTDTPSTLWWKRKPKALPEEVAEQKVQRVVRVIKEIAGKRTTDQTAKQAQREVAQAVAPLLADMPGFDWTPLYRNIVQKNRAREQMQAAIDRARFIEQDDEDVLLLLI